MADYVLDNKDLKIIKHLTKNARDSIRQIAKKTKLRPSTVHQRLLKLEKEKIIEYYTVKVNNEKTHQGFIVIMLISTCQDLAASFFQSSYVKEVFGITGEYDLFVKLKFHSLEDFNSYVIELRKNKAITKTLTQVVTITLKEEL